MRPILACLRNVGHASLLRMRDYSLQRLITAFVDDEQAVHILAFLLLEVLHFDPSQLLQQFLIVVFFLHENTVLLHNALLGGLFEHRRFIRIVVKFHAVVVNG